MKRERRDRRHLVAVPPPNDAAILDQSESLLGTRALERLLFDPVPRGKIERLAARNFDAWQRDFPSLADLPSPVDGARRLSVCIATEDIVGPVRNGGIGTTYSALAEFLAADGHRVTILYLRGREVENETIDHWIDHYQARGVTLVPVVDSAAEVDLTGAGSRWLAPSWNMMRHLMAHHYDVVHVSEWRGSGHLALAAKRQGLAFADTLFIVKASSPWMWNRLYGGVPLSSPDELHKVTAERRSIELADMVIGGSTHLLRWMASQGYELPAGRTFSQPNVVRFDHLKPLLERAVHQAAERVAVSEIVFFGRLEERKGLVVFLKAIKRLVRQGTRLPAKITFLGKPGARLASRPQETILDTIRIETKSWPTEVTVITDRQQLGALSYLAEPGRLAVMPSVIENSSLAVYEAAICGIPFVATRTGGTEELIRVEDHEAVLCDCHPVPLAAKLAEALEKGGVVAAPSFDNERNLLVWRDFHRGLANGKLPDRLVPEAGRIAPGSPPIAVSAVVHLTRGGAGLEETLASLAAQSMRPIEVLIAADAEGIVGAAAIRAAAEAHHLPLDIVDTSDFGVGHALTLAAERARGTHLLFLWAGGTLVEGAIAKLATTARTTGAGVMSWGHRKLGPVHLRGAGHFRLPLIGGLAEAFFSVDTDEVPLFVETETFERLGGFSTDADIVAHDQEFVVEALLAGIRCETIADELGAIRTHGAGWYRGRLIDPARSRSRVLRPILAAAPLAMRELLLAAKGLQFRGGAALPTEAGEAPPPRPRAFRAPDTGGRALVRKTLEPARQLPGIVKVVAARVSSSIAVAMPTIARIAGKRRSLTGDWNGGPRPRPTRGRSLFQGWGGPDPAGAARYEGHILAVHSGRVIGWVAALAEPRVKVMLSVVIDGVEVATIRADAPVPAAIEMPARMSHAGFVVDAFASGVWAGGARTVELMIAGTGMALCRPLVVAPPRARLARAGLEGYFDETRDGHLRGWVWDWREPGHSHDVAIFVDDSFLDRLRADRHRDDVMTTGRGTGDYGFELKVCDNLLDGPVRRVDVVEAVSGLALLRSPLYLAGRRLLRRKP